MPVENNGEAFSEKEVSQAPQDLPLRSHHELPESRPRQGLSLYVVQLEHERVKNVPI